MPSERTACDQEPAHGADAEGAGSVVVGADPSAPGGPAVHPVDAEAAMLQAREVGEAFQIFRQNLERVIPALHESLRDFAETVGRVAGEPLSEYDTGDAMHWSPPADGEETHPCPA